MNIELCIILSGLINHGLLLISQDVCMNILIVWESNKNSNVRFDVSLESNLKKSYFKNDTMVCARF